MLTTSLPLLPPPSSSLLPPFHTTNPDSQSHNASLQHPHQRRPKSHHNAARSSSLAHLSHDERAVSQRKLAIAMYGYSWLRPAGCSKTMLGRREEEIEREEVERQLAEVELQERNAMMAEEQERAEELRRQADAEARGEVVAEGRDLDDEIPDMDADGEEDDDDEGEQEDEDEFGEGEEDMEGDLDDEVPDADADAVESSWVYDTNRDPDTESDDGENNPANSGPVARSNRNVAGRGAFLGLDHATETDAMVNAMLDEDEMGELEPERDLDDSVPDMDLDAEMEDEEDYDLDDDIPAPDEEEEWQHTDTELEESEMDISVLPPGSIQRYPSPYARRPAPESAVRSRQRSINIGAGTTHEEMRRVSGNIMIPPPAVPHTGHLSNRPPPSFPPPQQAGARQARRIVTPQYQTPMTLDNNTPSFLSTDSDTSHIASHYNNNITNQQDLRPRNLFTQDLPPPSSAEPSFNQDPHPSQDDPSRPRQQSRLHAAGARRKLFGTESANVTDPSSRITTALDPASSSSAASPPFPSQSSSQQQQTTLTSRMATTTSRLRSGGLFTPEPRGEASGAANMAPTTEVDEPRSRTRSGMVVGGGAGVPRRRAGGVGGVGSRRG